MSYQLDNFGLTIKQRLFCEHWLENGYNGTQAAISSGYSKRTALKIASENLKKPDIRRYLKTRMKEAFEKAGAGIDWRVKALKEVGEACLQGKADKDGVVNAKGAVLAISEMNKMDGVYPAEKHAVLVEESKENKVSELVEKYEKEF